MTTKLKPADKFLHTHRTHCKVNLFSLQKERVCTCGRDALLKELEELRAMKQTTKPAQMEMVMSNV